MTFAKKLKMIRKQAGMSQEKLAEKIGVSRQAITKWETDMGIPDIENIMAISNLFNISIDELLSNKIGMIKKSQFLYESVTEYDIDHLKHYEMNLDGANTLVLSGYEGEKIHVRLASNTIATIQNDFKVKIDDIKNRIDVDVSRKNGMTEAIAKEAVTIFVQLPNQYIDEIELTVNAKNIEMQSLECDSIELDVKTQNVILNDIIATVEINCNLDMNIFCHSLNGAIEINQVSSTSRICVPEKLPFSVVTKGIRTKISYEKNGEITEDFSTLNADNVIELNGIKSELIIYTAKQEV